MARQKKQDKPRHVSIYYDQMLYDLDVMDNEYAGIILKMIVWYSTGTPEGEEKIAEMQKYIDTLPPMGKAWLTSMYKRLFSCIDEDFDAYAEICEKRRVLALEREERKRNERAQVTTSDHERAQVTTSDHKCTQVTTSDHKCTQVTTSDHLTDTDTDTDTDTELSNDNIKEEEEEEENAREEKISGKFSMPVNVKDFRMVWNRIIDKRKAEGLPCRLKHIKPRDMPSDAQERLDRVMNEIYDSMTQQLADDVLNQVGVEGKGRTKENAAKHYIIRAIENMADVKMKIDDTSFGSFQWFVKSPERIRKLFDKDIQ